jgi:chromosome segregation ATPase
MAKKKEVSTFNNPDTLSYLHILFDNNQVNQFEIRLQDTGDVRQMDNIDSDVELVLKFTGLARQSAFEGHGIFSFESLELNPTATAKSAEATDKDKETISELKKEVKNLTAELEGVKGASANYDADFAKATSEVTRLTTENEGLVKQINDLQEQLTAPKNKEQGSSDSSFEGNKKIKTT